MCASVGFKNAITGFTTLAKLSIGDKEASADDLGQIIRGRNGGGKAEDTGGLSLAKDDNAALCHLSP